MTRRRKVVIATFVIGVVAGITAIAVAQDGTTPMTTPDQQTTVADNGRSSDAVPVPADTADVPKGESLSGNIIGDKGPPTSMLEQCRSGDPGMIPAEDCKIAEAMADGSLKPGHYTDAQLQQELQADADAAK